MGFLFLLLCTVLLKLVTGQITSFNGANAIKTQNPTNALLRTNFARNLAISENGLANIGNGNIANGNIIKPNLANSNIRSQNLVSNVASNSMLHNQLRPVANPISGTLPTYQLAGTHPTQKSAIGNVGSPQNWIVASNLAGKNIATQTNIYSNGNIASNLARYTASNQANGQSSNVAGKTYAAIPGNQQYGINIESDGLKIAGTVVVSGRLPFQGTASLNGKLPAQGISNVNFVSSG